MKRKHETPFLAGMGLVALVLYALMALAIG